MSFKSAISIEGNFKYQVVLLACQVKVPVVWIECDSVEAIFFVIPFDIHLEIDFSLFELWYVPLLLNYTSWWVDLNDHVLVPDVSINITIYVLDLVHFLHWVSTLVLHNKIPYHCHVISIELVHSLSAIWHIEFIVFIIISLHSCNSPAFSHLPWHHELLLELQCLSVKHEDFLFLPSKHNKLILIAWTQAFAK